MSDNSLTELMSLRVRDLLKKISYDGDYFWMLDLSALKGPVSGNKAWKLLPNIKAMISEDKSTLLTFGGAYSNHIYQAAQLCHNYGLKSIGMIRSDQLDDKNPTLKAARGWGMQLLPISREDYRKKNETTFIQNLEIQFPHACIIPEGGTNALGVSGTAQLGELIRPICKELNIEAIHLPVGTGGTLAGIVNGIKDSCPVIGYGALRGSFLGKEIRRWVKPIWNNWICEDDLHFGGYGKWNLELIDFIQSFFDQTDLVTDPIYVGKMMFKAHRAGRLKEQSLFIHTGGQQGNAGMNQRLGLELPTI